MTRYSTMLVILGGALLFAARPARSQDAVPVDAVCATFLVDAREAVVPRSKLPATLQEIATRHAAEVEQWLEARGAEGRRPVYRTSVSSIGNSVVSEVVCAQ